MKMPIYLCDSSCKMFDMGTSCILQVFPSCRYFFRLYRECITCYNYCTCGNHARAVSIEHGIHTLWSLVEHNTGKDDRRKCVSIFPTAKKEDEKVQHEEVENVRNGFISSFRILLPQGKQWKYQCRKVIVVIPA